MRRLWALSETPVGKMNGSGLGSLETAQLRRSCCKTEQSPATQTELSCWFPPQATYSETSSVEVGENNTMGGAFRVALRRAFSGYKGRIY
eukprot:16434117-Heterocapsa_arctica.AAC.1